MTNYICYLDLIGIKDLAKYDPDRYFSAMEKFRDILLRSAQIFRGSNSKSLINFYSDSAFIQTEEIEVMFNFLMQFRKDLISNESLFFTAAITVGDLQLVNYSGNSIDLEELKAPVKSYIEEVGQYVRGTIFQSKDVSKVYVLQNDFKGIGVYIDEEVFELKKILMAEKIAEEKKIKVSEVNSKDIRDEYNSFLRQYVSKSFFFPSTNTETIKAYYDLKLSEHEMNEIFLETYLERYHNANTKNKKYGRYYVTHLGNWINSEVYTGINFSFEETEDGHKRNIESLSGILKYLIIEEDIIFKELKTKAHGFELLLFLLISKIYTDNPSKDHITWIIIQKMFKLHQSLLNKYLNQVDSIPDSILSPFHKDRFIDDIHIYLREQAKDKKVKRTNRQTNNNG